MTTLTVFSRPGCHLCDEMLFVLREIEPRYGFTLTVENVDSHEEWLTAHGNRVPVLVASNNGEHEELCWGSINDAAVFNWLEANSFANQLDPS